jgi:hypothetical protein
LREALGDASQVLIVFAAVGRLEGEDVLGWLRAACPQAALIGCSTAGELIREGVEEGAVAVTGVRFQRTRPTVICVDLQNADDSHAAGRRLAAEAQKLDPSAMFVLGPGVDVNGSALLKGVQQGMGSAVPVSGGLAGDGGKFRRTFVLTADGVSSRRVAALVVSGPLRRAYGSIGGWRVFGPRRRITRAVGNLLFELDGQPALELYKRYLGEYAQGLPASGLLFPFAMWRAGDEAPRVIRTILGIDEDAGGLVLAGDVSDAEFLQLMHASTDALIDGAHEAAEQATDALAGVPPELALLVSCVGRKLVMGGRTDDEVEAVSHVLGSDVPVCGFYSYGEIAPSAEDGAGELHNQTMTVTAWSEA